MSDVTGIVKIYINGDLQRSKEGASLSFGGYERTAQTGHALYGFSKKFVPSEVSFTVSHMADTDIISLNETEGASFVFETDTGKSFLVTNASVTTPVKLTGGDGDAEITMQGDPAVEG